MAEQKGIVARIDQLGRVQIPKQMRKDLGIGECDLVVVKRLTNRVVVEKYVTGE